MQTSALSESSYLPELVSRLLNGSAVSLAIALPFFRCKTPRATELVLTPRMSNSTLVHSCPSLASAVIIRQILPSAAQQSHNELLPFTATNSITLFLKIMSQNNSATNSEATVCTAVTDMLQHARAKQDGTQSWKEMLYRVVHI